MLLALAIFAIAFSSNALLIHSSTSEIYAGYCQCILASVGDPQITTHTALFALFIKDVSKLL